MASPCYVVGFLFLEAGVICGLLGLSKLVASVLPYFWVFIGAGMIVYKAESDVGYYIRTFGFRNLVTESIATTLARYFCETSGFDAVFGAPKIFVDIFPRLLFLACYAALFVVSLAVCVYCSRVCIWRLRLYRIQRLQAAATVISAEEGSATAYRNEELSTRVESAPVFEVKELSVKTAI
ncbi:uncharacterized protein V1518DRAFT_403403 [Limtongia smithiae]|uniref:uncharacterized protein n=1 Tax=Limtongia smithiae TaxID=1125753 RepID=UPI0034CE9A38